MQEENAKREAEKKSKQESANKQQNKPSEKKETATASKEFTSDSKFEDLVTIIGEELPVKFEFNKGVLQTDGNGEYILMDGEKYYAEEYYEDNDQKRDLKYYYVSSNTPENIKIEF